MSEINPNYESTIDEVLTNTRGDYEETIRRTQQELLTDESGYDSEASIRRTQQELLNKSLLMGVSQDPDNHARSLELGKRLNLPTDVVMRNKGRVEQQDKINGMNISELTEKHPELATFLSDPNNAAISHDDLYNLKNTHLLFDRAEADWSTIFKNQFSSAFGEIMAKQVPAGASQAINEAEVNAWDAAAKTAERLAEEPSSRIEETGQRLTPEMARQRMADNIPAEEMEQSKAVAQADADVAAKKYAESAARVQADMPYTEDATLKYFTSNLILSIPNMLVTLGVTASPLGLVGGLAAMASMVAPTFYAEARTEKDDTYNHRGIEKPFKTKRNVAESQKDMLWRTIFEIGPEAIPVGMVFKKGMGIAEKVLKVGFTESASEVVTELANILYDLEVLNDDLPPDEFFKRVRDAAVIGFMMGGGMSAPSAIAEGVTNKLDAVGISAQKKQAEIASSFAGQRRLDEGIILAQDSLVNQRSQGDYAAFIKTITNGERVYIEEEIALQHEELNGLFAQDESGAVSISMEDFLSKVATNKDLTEAIRPHIKVDQTHLLDSEINVGQSSMIGTLKQMVTKEGQLKSEADTVWESVQEQAEKAGVYTKSEARHAAALFPSYIVQYVNRARKAGKEITVEDAYKKMGFRVETADEMNSVVEKDVVTTEDIATVIESGQVINESRRILEGIDVDQAQAVISDENHEAWDVLRSYGIDPTEALSTAEELVEAIDKELVKRDKLVAKIKQIDNPELVDLITRQEAGEDVSEQLDSLLNVLRQEDARVDRNQRFKEWFGNSKASFVDETGRIEPLQLYFGTTNDVSELGSDGRLLSMPDSDQGIAQYATNNPEDASVNYASIEGGDLQNRIAIRAEEIEDEQGIEYDDALVIAQEEITVNQPNVMPVYMSIQNPVEIGGDNPTVFDFVTTYDVEDQMDWSRREGGTEEEIIERATEAAYDYPEQSGSIVEFLEAIETVGYDMPNFNYDDFAQGLIELAEDSGGLTFEEIKNYATNSNSSMYVEDPYVPRSGINELLRATLEEMGFDGIIDSTVSKKWGEDSSRREPMVGVNSETKHYLAFNKGQVKSIYNDGSWDSDTGVILQQSTDLPMDTASKMARAKEQGFDVDNIIYAGTDGTPSQEILPYGKTVDSQGKNHSNLFGGIFGSYDREVAESHGGTIQELVVKNSVTHDGFIHEALYDDDGNKKAIEKIRERFGKDITDDEANELLEYASGNKFAIDTEYSYHNKEYQNPPDMGVDRYEEITGHQLDGGEYAGEADWDWQGIKGVIARALNYDAVGMPDEHGESVLVLNGRSINAAFNPEQSDSPVILNQSPIESEAVPSAELGVSYTIGENLPEVKKSYDEAKKDLNIIRQKHERLLKDCLN